MRRPITSEMRIILSKTISNPLCFETRSVIRFQNTKSNSGVVVELYLDLPKQNKRSDNMSLWNAELTTTVRKRKNPLPKNIKILESSRIFLFRIMSAILNYRNVSIRRVSKM